MKIALNPLQTAITSDVAPPAPSPRVARHSAPAAPDGKQLAPPPELLQPAVTFRKDSAGKIYYIVTDPESGKEIRQVPADAVRKAAEGIDEFLKQLEAKQSAHVEVKV